MSLHISSLFLQAQDRHFDVGEPIFRTDDPVTHMFLVRQGDAALVRTLPSGDQAYLQRAAENELLAEASAYATTYHCDCIALKRSTLAVLPRSQFRTSLRSDPDMADSWGAHLARSVQHTRMRSEIRSLKTVAARLDAWLAEYGPLPDKGEWQTVAYELSVSREALYRELARRRS
ncbi:MAG: Crp/Fnr family transcriptional regulator [Silicimonas sp.]|nr:Crp/Fnr family transcriptional regulator [Silicimonas sp.]